MICVRDFPHGEVSMKVGVMEFGLKQGCIAGRLWGFDPWHKTAYGRHEICKVM